MKHTTALALCVAIMAIVLSACGDEASSGSPAASRPTPTPTAPPSEFTGNFAGTVVLDAGRTATVSLTVRGDATATGTLTITGGTTGDTMVPLTGFVDLIGGNFSLSGSSDVVSGTLPAPGGGSGLLNVQIGTNTTPFRGTIHAA